MKPAEVLDAKLALEAELTQPLYRLGLRYIRALADQQGQMSPLNQMQWQRALERLLLRHYCRVAMVMTGRRPSLNPTPADAALSLSHADRLVVRSREHAVMILRGVDRDFRAAMADQAADVVDDGTGHVLKSQNAISRVETKAKIWDVTAGYIGRLKNATATAINKLRSRLRMVVTTETNAPAEEARYEIVPDAKDADGQIVKRWVSLMDGRERDTHHEAHLVYADDPIPVDEAFQVGGYPIMVPGDSSLGAPMSEIINCRCAARYTMRKPDGTEVDIYTTPHAPARRQRRPGERVEESGRGLVQPTSVVRLNGRTRARVILGDGTPANMRQETPTTVVVTVGRQTVGRGTLGANGSVSVTVDPAYASRGVDGLIRRSIEHSYGRGAAVPATP